MNYLFDEYQEQVEEIMIYSGIEESLFRKIEKRVKKIIEESNGKVAPFLVVELIQNAVTSLYENDRLPGGLSTEQLQERHIVTLDLAINNAFENIGYSIGKKNR